MKKLSEGKIFKTCENVNNFGISLIVLVITVIVIIILAGAIISSILDNKIIDNASEAVFKSDIKAIQEELNLYLLSNMQSDGSYIYPTKEDIKSSDKYDQNVLDIIKGKIEFKNPDINEKKWLDELEINSDYTEGLVLDMPLGEYKTASLMTDKTEYNNAGIASGCTSAANRFGELNKSSSLSGSANISIPNNNSFSFNSFTISMWVYYRDYTYPKTFGAIKKSTQAYVAGKIGWDFGHGYKSDGVDVCLNDGINMIRTTLIFDSAYTPVNLLNKWSHVVYVVNRDTDRVLAYINGVKQSNEVNISAITGSLSNTDNLVIGTLYGWQTDGNIDDVRIYNRALNDYEVKSIYNLYWAD
jgi:hypothetical protein